MSGRNPEQRLFSKNFRKAIDDLFFRFSPVFRAIQILCLRRLGIPLFVFEKSL